MRRAHRRRLQPSIAPHARSDPAPTQGRHSPHRPGVGQARHACRVGHHAAQVTLVGVAPAQGNTSASPPPRHHSPQRARLGQAAQAAPVARRTFCGLGRRLGVQPHDGGGNGWGGRHGQRGLQEKMQRCTQESARGNRRMRPAPSLCASAAPILRQVQPLHHPGQGTPLPGPARHARHRSRRTAQHSTAPRRCTWRATCTSKTPSRASPASGPRSNRCSSTWPKRRWTHRR